MIKVTANINGEKREVTNYSYQCNLRFCDFPNFAKLIMIYKSVKCKEPPVEGDLITLTFNSTGKESFFYEWIISGDVYDGEIEFVCNEVDVVDIFRFRDCYCVGIEENMSIGGTPMTCTVYLSPGIIKRNNLPAREKVWKISDINPPTVNKNPIPTVEHKTQMVTPLVTGVQGNKYALPGQTIKYNVTNYNISNIKATDRDRVKWMISVEGKKELLNEQGDTLNLLIKDEWIGKEIVVMPYLKESTEKVSQKTIIKKKVIVFFIGGAGDKKPFMGIGPTNIMERVRIFFMQKVKRIENIDCKSFYFGYDELYPESDIKKYIIKEIENKNIPIFIVGHSFGGWNAAHLSKRLVQMGYKVNILITLDPVSGSSGVEYFADLYHETPIPVKANFWINISAYPKDFAIDDVIAHLGVQWKPWMHKPNIFHKTHESHGQAGRMLQENILDGKSALDFLIDGIKTD